MSELVMDYRTNPGALGASVGAVYFNASGQLCYVLNDGVEHPITSEGIPIWGETPSGAMNGSNPTFTLAHTPIAGVERVYYNGSRLKNGTGYTISGLTITMIVIPISGDTLIVDYSY